MAIGILGNPLVKGKSDVGVAALLGTSPEIEGAKAGLVVFVDNIDGVKDNAALAPDATTTQGEVFGILTNDITADPQGKSGFLVSVMTAGKSIPMQFDGTFDDVSKGIGFNDKGKIVQGDSADAVALLNGGLCSDETYKAIDETGKEVDCVLINLHSGGTVQKQTA